MKILIGPLLPDENKRINDIVTLGELAGELINHYDFRTFNLKYEKNGKTFFIRDFQEIIDTLPLEWYPDIIVFWRPEYEYVPEGIETVSCPVVAVIGDWYLGFDFLLPNLNRFDHVFTDKKGLKILKETGYSKADYFPMWAYDPELHKYVPETAKKYDISFVGKLNHNIHYERSKWLYRLAKLADRYNVKIFSGVFRENYVEILNQSRITFNYAMKHELNMRSYEALACKSLLFNEADNLEAPELFQDKEHCVYYDSENFEELLGFYLKNENEAGKIIEAGHKKVEPETYQNHLRSLVNSLKKIKVSERSKISYTQYLQQRVRTISMNFFSRDDIKTYLEDTLCLYEAAGSEEKTLLNNKGVLLCELISYEILKDKRNILTGMAVECFVQAIHEDNLLIPALYNLGLLCLLREDYSQSEKLFLRLNELFLNEISPDFNCLLYKNNSDQFNREYNEIFFNYGDHKKAAEFYKLLLLWKSNEFLGYINELKGNFKDAAEYYTLSLSYKPHIGTTRYRLAKIQFISGSFETAIRNFKLVLENEPFFMVNWFSLLEALKVTGQTTEKEQYIKEFLIVLESFGITSELEATELEKIRKQILGFKA